MRWGLSARSLRVCRWCSRAPLTRAEMWSESGIRRTFPWPSSAFRRSAPEINLMDACKHPHRDNHWHLRPILICDSWQCLDSDSTWLSLWFTVLVRTCENGRSNSIKKRKYIINKWGKPKTYTEDLRFKKKALKITISCVLFFNVWFICFFSPRIQPLLSGGPRLGRDGGMALCHPLSRDGDKTHRPQLSPPVRLCRYARCQAELILKPLDRLCATSGAFRERENWNVALNCCRHVTHTQIFSISYEHLQLHLVGLLLWCFIASTPPPFRHKGSSLVMKCNVISTSWSPELKAEWPPHTLLTHRKHFPFISLVKLSDYPFNCIAIIITAV